MDGSITYRTYLAFLKAILYRKVFQASVTYSTVGFLRSAIGMIHRIQLVPLLNAGLLFLATPQPKFVFVNCNPHDSEQVSKSSPPSFISSQL